MADTNQTLDAVIARLDALEQRNAAIEHDNAQLRHENHALRTEVSALTRAADLVPTALQRPFPLERVSRRGVLRNALRATAASLAAGVMLRRETQPADASHSTTIVNAAEIYAHYVQANNQTDGIGVIGLATSTINAGVYGGNLGAGPGILGQSSLGGAGVRGIGSNGVEGESTIRDASGVYGVNTGYGFGVAGDTTSGANTAADIGYARAGVFGRNNGSGTGVLGLSVNHDGDGVWGHGKVGVHGSSPNGNGVLGEGGTGYGGVFKGIRAQVRLTPATRAGKPIGGTHQIGELYLDKLGALFICTGAGSPGTWRKVSTTLG
jgi:hypothetical protein